MVTPMLDRPEECVLELRHLHSKSIAIGRVLSPVEVSVRTGIARSNEQLVYSVLKQKAPALFVTVKSLLLLIAIITPVMVIRFTPRKAKPKLNPVLVVMELLLQAKPAMTTPGIGLDIGAGVMSRLVFRVSLLLVFMVHVRRGREMTVSTTDSEVSRVMTTVSTCAARRPTGYSSRWPAWMVWT